MSGGKERRRQHYLRQSFQTQFILQFAGLVVLGCTAFGIALYLYSNSTLTTAFVNSKLKIMRTSDFLLPAMLIAALGVTALMAFMAATRLMFLSHRIAGPLYRFQKTTQAVEKGDLKLRVQLRRNDELQDVAQSMDGMVQQLRARAQVIKEQSERFGKILERVSQNSDIPGDVLKELRETYERIREVSRNFQV